MKVLVVGGGYTATRRLKTVLRRAGFEMLGPVASTANLHRLMTDEQPSAVIAAADSPARDSLEDIALSSKLAPKPMLTPGAGAAAGVSFYVASSVPQPAVDILIGIVVLHFGLQFDRRRHSRHAARPDEHELIARAKAYLMERDGLCEDEAYHRLRCTAMERGQRIAHLARELLVTLGESVDVGTEVATAALMKAE